MMDGVDDDGDVGGQTGLLMLHSLERQFCFDFERENSLVFCK
jgi:hypothetical protein